MVVEPKSKTEEPKIAEKDQVKPGLKSSSKMHSVSFSERMEALGSPFKILAFGAYCFFVAFYNTVFVQRNYKSIQDIKDKAFSKLWNEFLCQPTTEQDPATLTGSASLFPPMLAKATGVVLDLGPGNGMQVRHFTNPKVKTVYGVEPCAPLHDELQKQADASPVAGKYHIVEASAEPRSLFKQLRKHDLLPKGSTTPVFDTICCMRCLCSVPEPDKVVAGLYTLLKPGGKLLVVEHVINEWTTPCGSLFARLVQVTCQNLGFPFFIGNCHLNRDLTKIIDSAALGDGGWGSVEHEMLFGHSPFSYISAAFTKRPNEKS